MTTTSPASTGDRPGFEPRHPNAVPARCDGCPAPARWTRDGSRYCDEHAVLTTPMTTTDPASMGGPLSEADRAEVLVEGSWFKVDDLPEILGNFMRSSDEHAREAKALSMKLAEVRARVGVLEGQLATARAEATDMRAALHRRLLQVKSIRRDGHTPIDPMLCTTPVTTVEEEIEDARLWWTAVGNRNGALGLDGGDPDGE